MKVKILRSTVASGDTLSLGKVYDLSEKDAKLLIALGKAEPEEKRSSRGKRK